MNPLLSDVVESAGNIPLQNLNILDLPEEILIKISTQVRGVSHPQPYSNPGIEDIKNFRLTSQRLCATSSHLLIQNVRVAMTHLSLARLKSISLHPIFSKNVKSIRVLVHYFDSTLANSFNMFAKYHTEDLYERITSTERLIAGVLRGSQDFNNRLQDIACRPTQIAWQIWRSWDSLQRATPEELSTGQLSGYQDVLRQGHIVYQQLWAEQQGLRGSGLAFQSIAAAMGRMPGARALQFVDKSSLRHGKNLTQIVEDDKALFECLLAPLCWEEAEEQHWGQPPADSLFKLPSHIYELGTSLNSLDILLSAPEDLSTLEMQEDDLHKLADSMQQLKNCKFRLSTSTRRMLQDVDGLGKLKVFLMVLLNTESIERLDIHLEFCEKVDTRFDIDKAFSLGPLFSQRLWPKLRHCSLPAVPFRLHEAADFLQLQNLPALEHFVFGVRLLTGTWFELLDVLRSGRPYQELRIQPHGAECDAMTLKQKQACFRRPFDPVLKKRGGLGLAEMFVMGITELNPLRERGELVNDGN